MGGVGRHAEGAGAHPREAPLKISVSLSYPVFEPLTYRVAAETIEVGARVLVPLGNRLAPGWVTGLDSPYAGRLKSIIGIIDDPFYPGAAFMEMARQTAAAYFTSAGSVLDHCLPPSQKNFKKLRLELAGRERKLAEFTFQELELLAAAAPLRFHFKTPTPDIPRPAAPGNENDDFSGLLLGPRREPEYREACARTLARGRSVILIVPDNTTARYWQSVIPGVDMYHSETKAAAKEKIWWQYRQGKSGIVCGGISALMLPLADAGLLIIDRADSPLYWRSAGSPFRIDHLAEIRARSGRISLLRGAHSHSCSTYVRRQESGLNDRRREPEFSCQVHMLKGRERGIPAAIVEMICQDHLAQKKILVLVNRVQPAVHLFCDHCRRIAACPRCGGTLQVEETRQASCRRCTYRKDLLIDCPRCGRALTLLHDISIDSLAKAVERVCGEKSVLSLTAAELKEPQRAIEAVQSSPIVIATMAALNPFFAELFHAVLWVKPESFFQMEDFNASEMIHACGAEIAAALGTDGEMHVFSVFHFHYALQYLMDESHFFERELKYRQWFMLPPFASVYELELRDPRLRSLAAAMRELHARNKAALQIQRVYLASRQPQRGTYRGVLELHTTAEKIAAAGLHRIKKSSLRRTAG
jgi:primosomal protein N'